MSCAGKSRFHWFSNHSCSWEPKQPCELGQLHNPQAQRYCYVSWVLSYKAHYAAETERRHRPGTAVAGVCALILHTHAQYFNLCKDMHYQYKSQHVLGLLICVHATVRH